MAKTTKKTTPTPSAKDVVPSPVIEKEVDTPPSVDESVDEKPKDLVDTNPATVYQTKLNGYIERVGAVGKEVKELVALGRTIAKEYQQIMKIMSKKSKYVKSNEDRPLSGFAMPSLLSDELYEFLNLEKGVKVPRKDVTRMMNEYIKTNSLRDEEDKRNITPDKKLHKIFNSTDNDKITYFNLQTYMKHHFIKESSMAKVAV
tara:strand:- start:35 stop:640 length:606 start_codon:yes stop_codon:yes gene_type:complete